MKPLQFVLKPWAFLCTFLIVVPLAALSIVLLTGYLPSKAMTIGALVTLIVTGWFFYYDVRTRQKMLSYDQLLLPFVVDFMGTNAATASEAFHSLIVDRLEGMKPHLLQITHRNVESHARDRVTAVTRMFFPHYPTYSWITKGMGYVLSEGNRAVLVSDRWWVEDNQIDLSKGSVELRNRAEYAPVMLEFQEESSEKRVLELCTFVETHRTRATALDVALDQLYQQLEEESLRLSPIHMTKLRRATELAVQCNSHLPTIKTVLHRAQWMLEDDPTDEALIALIEQLQPQLPKPSGVESSN